jgi:hypothetical protein
LVNPKKSTTFVKPKRQTPLGKREISSAGSEHLPYKQRVTGSNPVSPTTDKQPLSSNTEWLFYFWFKRWFKQVPTFLAFTVACYSLL